MSKKYSKEELIELTNQAISELVYDKDDLQKSYNYYHGYRDEDQFRYISENFGIGHPTAITFTPLIKKHVDALIGEYLGFPILPKVTCKDKETVTNMMHEKELEISNALYTQLQKRLQNKLLNFLQTQEKKDIEDPNIAEQLQLIASDLEQNFVSKYEIAAQDVIEYIKSSRQTDLTTKLKQMFLDMLVSGYTCYYPGSTPDGTNITVEVLSPLDVFPDKNPNSPYLKDSYRIVVRRWLTKTEVLNRYGKDLSKADRDLIKDKIFSDKFDNPGKYVRAITDVNRPTMGVMADTEVRARSNNRYQNYGVEMQRIPVYEVQWLETDDNFIMQRYETIRIGEEIYITKGLDEHVQRSISDPTYCSLTVNGVFFENRTNEPFSLVKSCMALQDRYDLLIFYRDNVIATSGTVGDWLDVSLIPDFLGENLGEKVQKWIAYKKSGIGLIDSAQEGRMLTGQASLNTIFNGYDDTVKTQAIQAIQLAIDSVEATMSSITGVFRERLNGIEQRDAVTNVKVSQNNSFTVTKHWYHQMDVTVEELLTDLLNKAKVVFKNGLVGTAILGEKYQKIFTALPEYFTASDFDVHVLATSDIAKDIEQIKQLVPTLVQAQALPADAVVELLDCKSLSDAKYKVSRAMKKQKEEQNQIGQLQQQLQEMQEQLKQAQNQIKQSEQENKKLSTKLEQLNEQKLELEAKKNEQDAQIRWFEAQTERQYKTVESQNDTKRTQIELDQLNDGNPNNDDIRQIHN